MVLLLSIVFSCVYIYFVTTSGRTQRSQMDKTSEEREYYLRYLVNHYNITTQAEFEEFLLDPANSQVQISRIAPMMPNAQTLKDAFLMD